jgi:hypothetical protein
MQYSTLEAVEDGTLVQVIEQALVVQVAEVEVLVMELQQQ